ncbi:GNAT family N-acetyltransferase [Paracoccus aerodenitrificans]|uniref:GNAT family N-acetyltransferase n=1 Tax=Paracoccus aerodenitrificans TaxID=3017781 RepID=UPI0022F0FC6E|nr:GNAT family N-acetyltransferase [Paracoccus aerodenitrificans]WBU65471.1 GNAT family N-acetyltransferase [Paracoccus aerodenitrificans]
MPGFHIENADPLDPDLDLLFARHRQFCHVDTPPESIHMLDRSELAVPEISLLVLRHGSRAIAMGAIKIFTPDAAELKSMHVLEEMRGTGAAQRVLDALIDLASKQGLRQVFLETGAQPSFEAARSFYRRAGFQDCPPFGSYLPDPMSTFMKLKLSD